MERRIAYMNWKDIKERDISIDRVILPVGTMEAHGITLTGTDIFIPESLSYDMAAHLNALVLPAMPYGVTSSLLPYPGSIDIGADNLYNIIYEIARSIAKDGFRYFILMNGHGGNNDVLSELKKDIFTDTGMYVIIVHWWEFAYEITKKHYNLPGGHAGVDETAMIIHICPEIRVSRKDDDSLHYRVKGGIETMPVPGPVIDYSDTPSSIVMDRDKASAYYNDVLNFISGAVADIIGQMGTNLGQ